jgi:quinoprotein glucose dehydrogenase
MSRTVWRFRRHIMADLKVGTTKEPVEARYVVPTFRSAVVWVAAAFVAMTTSVMQSASDKWWPGYGNGPDNSRYFASKEINKSNVAQLQVVWTYPHGETGFSPIVVRGVAYGRGRNGSLVALDAKSGKELWVRENMNGMTSRGMMYWESRDGRDQRLIFSMNSLLQEVDAKTGKSIMSFGVNGVVDLRVGLDGRDPATLGNVQTNTPSEVFENLIILGSAPGEGYMSAPGDIRAYDAVSGKLVWTFHTVPRPGEFGYETWPKDAWKYVGGVNNWGEMTVDVRRGIVFVPIGSPTYDYYGADRIGANLFGSSILALDARTGKRLWHFQMVHHDLWDFDNNAAPQLTTIRHNGRNRDVVAVAGKTGWLYVFDRVTGEPIWPIEERPVPQTDMPGEQTWPTQPYPTNPPPFAKQSLSVDDINPYLEPAEYEAFKKRVLAANNKGLFTPINHTDTVHIPGSNGGALFGATAAEPNTGAVYVITQDNPGMLRLLTADEIAARSGGFGPPGQFVYQRYCQQCHGADRLGSGEAVPLVYKDADPANNIVAGASRFSAEEIRTILETGRGRMPAFPHITAADTDILVRYLTAVPGPGRGGFGRGGGPVASGAPPELIAGSGSAWTRPEPPGGRGRGGATPYPEGVRQLDQLVINEYGTIGSRMKPPFTTIVKYDLNEPAIKWRIGFGDDPALAARGITGTGVPQMRNSIIVTESGLVFGAGRDNQVRAWDSETGKQLWSSRFGGNFVGSPAMYEMDGKAYLLVGAAGASAGRGRGAGPAAGASSSPTPEPAGPMGWVVYSVPPR